MAAVITAPSVIDSFAGRAHVNVPKGSLQTAEVGDHQSLPGFLLFPSPQVRKVLFTVGQSFGRPGVFSPNSRCSSCSFRARCLETKESCPVFLLVRATFLLVSGSPPMAATAGRHDDGVPLSTSLTPSVYGSDARRGPRRPNKTNTEGMQRGCGQEVHVCVQL